MSDLKQELCNFEGSDALGVGDFSVCLRAATRIAELEAALRDVLPYVDTCNSSHREAQAKCWMK